MTCPHCGKEIPLVIESGIVKKVLTLADHIEIPADVDTIDDEAFMRAGRIKTIEFAPDSSLDYIGTSAFANCVNLLSITIPDTVTIIDFEAFSECSSLQSVVLPKGLSIIEEKTFYHCSALTSINIPENVETIGPHAFGLCSSLSELILPEGLKKIKNDAFHSCGLKTIALPGTLQEIGESAFKNCKHLEEIKYNGTIEQWSKVKRKAIVQTVQVTCTDGKVNFN